MKPKYLHASFETSLIICVCLFYSVLNFVHSIFLVEWVTEKNSGFCHRTEQEKYLNSLTQ